MSHQEAQQVEVPRKTTPYHEAQQRRLLSGLRPNP